MNLSYFKKDSKIQIWVCIDSLGDAGGTFWQAVLTIIGLKKNNFNVCCFLKFKPRDNNNYLKILLENNIYLSYPKNFLNDYYKLISVLHISYLKH
ncbi:unnamed protein product [marine sediment metagenome]|uniref:Uncharacterized protein n=1 Tax=marine sediment metagenome TaxID=412755 RepID=X1ICV8_9ZZZZ